MNEAWFCVFLLGCAKVNSGLRLPFKIYYISSDITKFPQSPNSLGDRALLTKPFVEDASIPAFLSRHEKEFSDDQLNKNAELYFANGDGSDSYKEHKSAKKNRYNGIHKALYDTTINSKHDFQKKGSDMFWRRLRSDTNELEEDALQRYARFIRSDPRDSGNVVRYADYLTGHNNGLGKIGIERSFQTPSESDDITTTGKGKRSAGCMRRCMEGGMLHPAQCHSMC